MHNQAMRKLSKKDKDRVEKEADPFGKNGGREGPRLARGGEGRLSVGVEWERRPVGMRLRRLVIEPPLFRSGDG